MAAMQKATQGLDAVIGAARHCYAEQADVALIRSALSDSLKFIQKISQSGAPRTDVLRSRASAPHPQNIVPSPKVTAVAGITTLPRRGGPRPASTRTTTQPSRGSSPPSMLASDQMPTAATQQVPAAVSPPPIPVGPPATAASCAPVNVHTPDPDAAPPAYAPSRPLPIAGRLSAADEHITVDLSAPRAGPVTRKAARKPRKPTAPPSGEASTTGGSSLLTATLDDDEEAPGDLSTTTTPTAAQPTAFIRAPQVAARPTSGALLPAPATPTDVTNAPPESPGQASSGPASTAERPAVVEGPSTPAPPSEARSLPSTSTPAPALAILAARPSAGMLSPAAELGATAGGQTSSTSGAVASTVSGDRAGSSKGEGNQGVGVGVNEGAVAGEVAKALTEEGERTGEQAESEEDGADESAGDEDYTPSEGGSEAEEEEEEGEEGDDEETAGEEEAEDEEYSESDAGASVCDGSDTVDPPALPAGVHHHLPGSPPPPPPLSRTDVSATPALVSPSPPLPLPLPSPQQQIPSATACATSAVGFKSLASSSPASAQTPAVLPAHPPALPISIVGAPLESISAGTPPQFQSPSHLVLAPTPTSAAVPVPRASSSLSSAVLEHGSVSSSRSPPAANSSTVSSPSSAHSPMAALTSATMATPPAGTSPLATSSTPPMASPSSVHRTAVRIAPVFSPQYGVSPSSFALSGGAGGTAGPITPSAVAAVTSLPIKQTRPAVASTTNRSMAGAPVRKKGVLKPKSLDDD